MREELDGRRIPAVAQKVNLELLARVAKSDCLGRAPGTFDCSAMDWFLERARELGVDRRPPKPLLLGRHLLELGMTPGPEMGALLKQIYEKQLDGEIKTTEDGTIALRFADTLNSPHRKDATSAESVLEQKIFFASPRLRGEI